MVRIGVTLLIAAVLAACQAEAPPPLDLRSRVIDRETGQGIPGAIVVARYMGSRGAEGSTACNRIESAVSDADGWVDLPHDPRTGIRLLAAYHRDYRLARPPRLARRTELGWQVMEYQRAPDDSSNSILNVEPKIYQSERDARNASRESDDVFMVRFRWTREERLEEIRGLRPETNCGGPPQQSQGAIPFLEAILAEQVQANDSEVERLKTKERIDSAQYYLNRARERQR